MSPTRRVVRHRTSRGNNGHGTAVLTPPQGPDSPPPPAPPAGAAPLPGIELEDQFEDRGGPGFQVLEREDPELEQLEELVGPGLALVYRIEAGLREMVGKMDRTRLLRDHELIGTTWGGGEYEVDFKNEKGTYLKRFVRFRFDPRVYGDPKGTASKSAPAAAGPGTDIITMMNAQAERNNALLLALIAKPAPEPPPPAVPPMGLQEVLAVAKQMIENKQADAELKAGAMEESVEKMIAAGLAKAGETSSSPVGQFLTKLAEVGLPVIAQLVAKSQSGAVTARGPRAPAGRSRVKPPKEDQVDLIAMMVRNHALYKANAPQVMNWARSGRNPAEVAVDVHAMIPAEQIANVSGFLSRPDCWGWIKRIQPDAAPYKQWFSEVVKDLRESLSAAPPAAEAPALEPPAEDAASDADITIADEEDETEDGV